MATSVDSPGQQEIPHTMQFTFLGTSAGEQYPGFCCNGGIDKTKVAEGGAALEREFETRFETAWELGRYTPSLDHSFPPDISWQNAQRYAQLFLELCERPTTRGA